VSLIINAIIVWGTWALLRDSVTMSLNAVPAGLESSLRRCSESAWPGEGWSEVILRVCSPSTREPRA
jgi:hypothetical protein